MFSLEIGVVLASSSFVSFGFAVWFDNYLRLQILIAPYQNKISATKTMMSDIKLKCMHYSSNPRLKKDPLMLPFARFKIFFKISSKKCICNLEAEDLIKIGEDLVDDEVEGDEEDQ